MTHAIRDHPRRHTSRFKKPEQISTLQDLKCARRLTMLMEELEHDVPRILVCVESHKNQLEFGEFTIRQCSWAQIPKATSLHIQYAR